MIPDRRTYSLSKDQPILREARRRRTRSAADRERMEVDFWRHLDLDKFAADWRRGVGKSKGCAAA